MDRRIELHQILCGLLEDLVKVPERHVYFQPPATVKLTYPCIIYKLSGDAPRYADNLRYMDKDRYSVTVIDRNPDSPLAKRVRTLRYCRMDRPYTADNLNHFPFDIYY